MAIFVEPHSHPFAHMLNNLLGGLEPMDRQCLTRRKINMGLDLGKEMKDVVDDDKMLTISIDVSHFAPEELKVNLDGRVLSIEANQEKNDGTSSFQRSFTRKWTLPEDVDLTAIKSSMTPEGTLNIEAPKKGNSAVQNIPITLTSKQSS